MNIINKYFNKSSHLIDTFIIGDDTYLSLITSICTLYRQFIDSYKSYPSEIIIILNSCLKDQFTDTKEINAAIKKSLATILEEIPVLVKRNLIVTVKFDSRLTSVFEIKLRPPNTFPSIAKRK